jgi:hypothetical protein
MEIITICSDKHLHRVYPKQSSKVLHPAHFRMTTQCSWFERQLVLLMSVVTSRLTLLLDPRKYLDFITSCLLFSSTLAIATQNSPADQLVLRRPCL